MIGVLRVLRAGPFARSRQGSRALLRRPAAIVIAALLSAGVFAAPQSAHANDKYAAFVIDAQNGKVLFSRYADSRRYPASLTKIMTIYLLFEDMEAGKITKNTPLKASSNAAGQAPSKIGIKAGETLTVDQAIRALVTKSANDVAVVVAENLNGSVSSFANRMTRTAHSIGMRQTKFLNPHGLPNSGQSTTARDMSKLAIQTMRRFPKYYYYFQTRSFKWKGTTYGNHNKLLGRVAGVDGLKTGYIRASGFNLVSSMRRDGRHIVGVVMGGRSGATRDAHMRELLETHIRHASRGGTMMFANAPLPRSRPEDPSLPVSMTSAQTMPVPKIVVPSTSVPGTLVAVNQSGAASGLSARAGIPIPTPAPTAVATAPTQTEMGSASPPPSTGGWIIQVGAFNSEQLAIDALNRAKSRAPSLLSAATAFTETTSKNGTTLWRARFAGFDQSGASGACAQLKRQSFGCFPARH